MEPKPSGPVFTEQSIASFRRTWPKARNAVGLPKLRVHDFRMTFGRELATTSVDLATIQDLLGHRTATITRRSIPRSLHPMRGAVRKLGGTLAVDDLLDGAKKNAVPARKWRGGGRRGVLTNRTPKRTQEFRLARN